MSDAPAPWRRGHATERTQTRCPPTSGPAQTAQTQIVRLKAQRRRKLGSVRNAARLLGQFGNVERGIATILAGPHGTGHRADDLAEHDLTLLRAAVEVREQHGGANRRVPGERQLPRRRENAQPCAMLRLVGGNTNTVSGRLYSRATLCIAAVSRPPNSKTTASGLPAKRLVVKTSSVKKRRRIVASFKSVRRGIRGWA